MRLFMWSTAAISRGLRLPMAAAWAERCGTPRLSARLCRHMSATIVASSAPWSRSMISSIMSVAALPPPQVKSPASVS